MADDDYSKREIDTYFDNLHKQLEELQVQMKEGFDGVHLRQNRTNGKVSENTRWRYMMVGAIAVITAVIFPLLLIALKAAI